MTKEEYKAYRESLGVTQRELAAILGENVSTIFKRENGNYMKISDKRARDLFSLSATDPRIIAIRTNLNNLQKARRKHFKKD